MKAEHSKKITNVNSTKITSFHQGKPKDTIIKHAKLKEKKDGVKGEEIIQQESDHEEEDSSVQNKIVLGNYVFLPDKGYFAQIKSKIDENLYESIIKKSKTEQEESMLFLMPLGQEDGAEGEITKWTNQVKVNVRIILNDEKR